MEQKFISQTAFDQMVGSDQNQMMKAMIPYLPPKGQQILSVFTKAMELSSTLALFSPANTGMQMQAAGVSDTPPLEIINDIRRFCYGESRHRLDQMVNMLAVVQMLQLMNDPSTGKEQGNE